MRTVPPALQTHLDTGATTLCLCWKLTRTDGTVLGFTDHDRPLTFDSVTYQAATGATASALEGGDDLAVDNMTVEGALASGTLNEAELDAGLFDDAGVEIYRVNWAATDERLLLKKGTLGEVRRGRTGYRAEFRGLTHVLDQTVGRRYQHRCDADLGDTRCGVDLENAAYKGTGAVASALDDRRFTVTGLDGFATDWFTRGRLLWTSGANSGRAMEVKAHVKTSAGVSVELWRPMAETIAVSEAFTVTAGCDKRFETCKDRFSNAVNFRGFHLMPGNDFAQSYPNRGDVLDGGRR